jgi:quercetin dioxygenase-like cupin family protein
MPGLTNSTITLPVLNLLYLELAWKAGYFYFSNFKSEVMKKHILIMTFFALTLAVHFSANPVSAQSPKAGRIELQDRDLSISNRECIQAIIAFEPGTAVGMHFHPGEEIIYVTEGILEHQIECKSPITLKAGEVLFIPTGTKYSAKNVGKLPAKELAIYIVEKGEPLVFFQIEFTSINKS